MFRFPLGPVFADHPFPGEAFEHAGGEIIFNLANGLQGFLLVDAGGNRIDTGPPTSSATRSRPPARPRSSTGCHAWPVTSTGCSVTRITSAAVSPSPACPRQRPSGCCPRKSRWTAPRDDEARFLKAPDEATGSFLEVGDDQTKAINEFPEPITAIAMIYLKDLGPDEMAAELGLQNVQALETLIGSCWPDTPGPRVLADWGEEIKRKEWTSLKDRTLSHFSPGEPGDPPRDTVPDVLTYGTDLLAIPRKGGYDEAASRTLDPAEGGDAPTVTAALLALAGPARADQTLDKEMAELARQVQLTLKDRKTNTIQVGDILAAKGNPAHRERREGRRLPGAANRNTRKAGHECYPQRRPDRLR